MDVWHDLREKRLLPIAIAMALALVAVPVLLIKPVEKAPSGSQAAALTGKRLQPLGPGDKAILVTATTSLNDGSNLRAFARKNPFQPLPQLAQKTVPPTTGNTGGAVSVARSNGGSTQSGGGGGSGSSVPGGGSAPGSSQPLSLPSGGGHGAAPRKVIKTFVYTADLHFGFSGKEHAHKGVTQLKAIPSSRSPLLVFLGVTADRRRAVFLVDAALRPSGEGKCRPSAAKCTFLYLAGAKNRDEERFTDAQGTGYTLRLDRLNRVDIDSLRAKKRKARSSQEASIAPVLAGFGFPLLDELEQQSTTLPPGQTAAAP